MNDGTYWGAAGFLRDKGEPWFTEADVRALASLSAPIADGFRRALIVGAVGPDPDLERGPGVVIFDENGVPESVSPAAEHWIEQLVEEPRPASPTDSRAVQGVATRPRAARAGQDPLELTARCRARTRSGPGCCCTASGFRERWTTVPPSSSSRRRSTRWRRLSRSRTGYRSGNVNWPACASRAGRPRRWRTSWPSPPTRSRTT